MANSRTTKQNYQDIADAIRTLNGETEQYYSVDMAPKILALQKKNNEGRALDYYQLELLYSEDTTTLHPAYSYYDDKNSDKLHDFVEVDISSKNIQNKFNEFIIRYDLVDIDGFAPITDPHVIIYEPLILTNYPMMYNQENQNPIYDESTITFNSPQIQLLCGDSELDYNKSNQDIIFNVTLNSVKHKDNIIQSLVLDKFAVYYVSSDDVIEFDSPITKLAIYGATPIYK